MTQREFGVCIECGERSELLLARRFPHICHACLFPPPPKPDPRGGVPDKSRNDFVLTLMDVIDSWKVQGRGIKWSPEDGKP